MTAANSPAIAYDAAGHSSTCPAQRERKHGGLRILDDLDLHQLWPRSLIDDATGPGPEVKNAGVRLEVKAGGRARLLDAEMQTVGRALRAFVREDDRLARREWAESVATALDDLGPVGWTHTTHTCLLTCRNRAASGYAIRQVGSQCDPYLSSGRASP